MKKLLFTLVLFWLVYNADAQHKQVRQLDSIFAFMHHQNQFNGTVLIADKGKIIYNKGFGLANEKTGFKNGSQTIFELASCTKQFTAAAIVLLKRQGKLDYNDKITKFLPELAFWDNVTIMDLVKHTSGIPEYLLDLPKSVQGKQIANNKDLISFYQLRKDTLQFPPGSRHRYNNTNYALLATIIERASGKTYASFLNKTIFEPLKMKHTFVYNRRQEPKKVKNHAMGYVWAKSLFDKVVPEDTKHVDSLSYKLDGVVGNAKVNSTVEDVYKWINSLKSNTLFSKQEFELMTEVTKTSEGKNIPYGFGLDVSKGKDRFSFGHTGSWDGYATFTYHNMLKDRTIIVLENFKLGTYPYQNINEILDGKPITVEYPKKVDLPEVEIRKFAGIYVNDKNEQQLITYVDGHLIHNSDRVAWDMRFFPISGNEFQAIRQGGTDGVLKFTVQENGAVKLEMLQYGQLMGWGIKQK
ncbi:serine hydrolase domain-containing protein [Pedobacter ureilyticus]|uniref:Serine hydrolase domain-containing protein n=1 Tax=Pedobacter ureilyticus TaxID=1393051 RepID=A0ABW9J2L8_9SPHI|nr:serine hydrolase domain-containing protein [Pedobacter helvus]